MTININDNELIDAPLWWHKRGLSQTASGYGSKLTTRYKFKWGKKLYRVYACCWSNTSTLYIIVNKVKLILR